MNNLRDLKELLLHERHLWQIELETPHEVKPLDVIRRDIARRIKLIDVLVVWKSIVFKSGCFQLNLFPLPCFVFRAPVLTK